MLKKGDKIFVLEPVSEYTNIPYKARVKKIKADVIYVDIDMDNSLTAVDNVLAISRATGHAVTNYPINPDWILPYEKTTG